MSLKLRTMAIALSGAWILGSGAPAFADTTDDLLNALIAKGVLSEEEGALLLKGRSIENDNKKTAIVPKFKDGMTLESADGKHSISLNGRLHTDYRHYDYDSANKGVNTGAAADTFDVRRARLGLKGKVYENYEFEVSADIANPTNGNTNSILDVAFLNINYWKPLQLRVGQFKMPMNLEKVSSSNYTDFMERSVLNQFAPNNDRGAMIWGIPKDGITYALAVSNGEGQNRTEKDSRVDDLEFLGRGTVNFAQLMENKDAVFHLGAAFSSTDISKTSSKNGDISTTAGFDGTNFLAGTNGVRTEGRGVTYFTFPTLLSVANVDNAIERKRYALEGAVAYGPVKLQAEWMKTSFSGDLTTTRKFDADVNTWYAEALWLITGEKYADFYKEGAWGAIKPKNNFELGKDGLGAWELGLRYSRFDASDFNTPFLTGANNTNGVGTAIVAAGAKPSSTFEANAYTAGIKFIPTPNTRFLLNYVHTSFDTPILVAGEKEDNEDAISVRAQYNF